MASVLDCGAKGRFVEAHSGDRLLTTQQPSLRETNLSREANTTGDGWALLSTYRVLDIAIKAVSLCDPLPLTFFFLIDDYGRAEADEICWTGENAFFEQKLCHVDNY